MELSVCDPNFGWDWEKPEKDARGRYQPGLTSRARPLTLVLHGRWRKQEAGEEATESTAVEPPVQEEKKGSKKGSKKAETVASKPATVKDESKAG
jgi:hypothetical protein